MIWLVGASGMLGTDLGQALTAAGLPWMGTDREVDASDASAVATFANAHRPQWIINCAAYTAVDKAEDEPELCRRLNVEVPRQLGEWARNNGAALVQISTDYVFPGTATKPYREDDPVGPIGVYAVTKEEGERVVRQVCPEHYILRTAWLYGAHGKNFVDTMLTLMSQRDQLGVVADQQGAPTWTVDLASVVTALVQRRGPWGTYHASGEGQCSWHEFAQAIFEDGQRLGRLPADRVVQIKALTTAEYPTKARRPPWSVLSKQRLQSVFGLSFPPWRDSLQRYLQGKT